MERSPARFEKLQINTPISTETTVATFITLSPTSTVKTTQTSPLPLTRKPTPSTPYPAKITVPPDLVMRLVQASDFTVGSNNGGNDEKPTHVVYLDDYYIDEYEITNARYKACLVAGVCKLPKENMSSTHPNYFGNSMFGNFPVIYVDWNMAKTYCEWRGARLPTEAEWEKAARGTDGRTYPWGEELNCNLANYGKGDNTCKGDTTAVGSYKDGQSPYDVYDMAGNVSEWVADWYQFDYYATLVDNFANPLGPDSGIVRVVRGGSWSINDNDIRSSNRNGYSPLTSTDYIGFRCALTP